MAVRMDELRRSTKAELFNKLDEAESNLVQLRFKHQTRQLKQTHLLNEAKKLIARIKTLLSSF